MTSASSPLDRPALLASLRRQVAVLEHAGTRPDHARRQAVPLCAPVDQVLPAGGLARAALHEVLSPTALTGAALGFATLALARSGGTVIWIGAEPEAWTPGLVRFGLDPSRLLLAQARRPADALWAMEEALRCPAISAALLVQPSIGLTAGRRLMLAAEAGGGLGLLLRADSLKPGPAVALTRWRVAPLPSGAPTEALWRVELLRSRGGTGGQWRLRWDQAEHALVEEQVPHSEPIKLRRVG